ncbi:TPA: hypothetical protein NHP34_006070 [Pseudomonas aeruginosa]|nr:hypothetical protein [Pseudomonas aeruginosa]
MTFALEIRHAAPAAPAVDCWVELEDAPSAAQVLKARPRRPAVTLQDLQWLRERLMFAYLAPGDYRDDRPPQKLLGAFDTSGTRDAFPRYRAQELAECMTEDGRKAGRLPFDYVASLARDTTRVTVSETRKKKTSSHPLPPSAFDDARLVRIVAAQPPAFRHWLRYAYADSKDWSDEAAAVVELWARVSPAFGKLQGKTLQKLKGLAHLAVQHGKRYANNGQELYQAARLAELLGVKTSNYDQHWRPRWQALLAGLQALDEEALRAVLQQYDNN